MNVLGLFGGYYNPAACLVKDGKLVAFIEEEKLSRTKNETGYPVRAIKYVLEEGGLKINEVDKIAYPWQPRKNLTSLPFISLKEFAKGIFSNKKSEDGIDIPNTIPNGFNYLLTLLGGAPGETKRHILQSIRYSGMSGKIPEIEFVPHHKSHAASCFYASGFDESLILVMDGMGDDLSSSVWVGKNKKLECIKEIKFPNSLGEFYCAFTEFLGFRPYSGEGKLMGLAAYGKLDDKIVEKLEENVIFLNGYNYQVESLYTINGKHSFGERYTDRLVALFGEPRQPEADIVQFHYDLAYAAQYLLEKAALRLLEHYIKQTGIHNICLSGGVAMNCKMNGRLLHDLSIEKIFINPASNDAGAAMGAALAVSADLGDDPSFLMSHPFYGPSFSNDQVEAALREAKVKYYRSDDLADEVSSLLKEGKIIGWHQGRQEVGARALGARSILASPLKKEMIDKVNRQVKHREAWRPFAPAMCAEDASKYYSLGKLSPFMILAFTVLEDKRAEIPAVTHVDNTCRPQTVERANNPKYYDVIKKFGEKTGTPVVLNTSFNVRGEPIVSSPADSLRCFFSTGIDVLVIEDFIVKKSVQ